ncbi:MAG TPA: UDP-3-O-acyl-N-acetylglucosamine deacetylase [Planctomycetota bacterium]|nr:UDP-3-O-acyl-N-acetylglucosamine deacetylase [Planctomycetota bacterium]
MRKTQRTLKAPIRFSGPGLFTGAQANLVVEPAKAGTGLVFIRTDLPGQPQIDVVPDNVTSKVRRTALSAGTAEVETVEHLLSALYGLGVDNATIKIDASEIPHADGSAKTWVDLLSKTGYDDQEDPRRVVSLKEPVAVSEKDAHLVAFPSDTGLNISYSLNYPGTPIGSQAFSLSVDEESFAREIAPARTFCLQGEAEALQKQGLGSGGTTSNTLVVGKDGPIDNKLRWPDEYVRHKILDLVGDLALLGGSLRAKVIAVGSGHGTNARLVRRIQESVGAPGTSRRQRDATLLDVREIAKVLPHRYPMLLIDRVIEMDGYKRAVGIKNVTFNEPFFQGHFPGQPIMPGVLQVEAMAQLAGALLMRKADKQASVAVLFALDGVRLRKNVVPGDQLRIEVETVRLKASNAEIAARATVDGQIVCEANMRFMLSDGPG